MKSLSKPPLQLSPKSPDGTNSDKMHTRRVHLSIVTEKERETFRVPSYGYIL